jgi:signal peptidase II
MSAAAHVAPGWQRWLWLSVAVIVLDQVTKHLIVAVLHPGESIVVLPVLALVLAFNRGAAFSFLAGADGWQRWLFALVAIAACGFMAWLLRRGGSRWLCAGLALVIGGALGNLWDRLWLGHVVDFVLVHYRGWSFPAFNVADSAISIGAALLIFDSFFRQRPAPALPARER